MRPLLKLCALGVLAAALVGCSALGIKVGVRNPTLGEFDLLSVGWTLQTPTVTNIVEVLTNGPPAVVRPTP